MQRILVVMAAVAALSLGVGACSGKSTSTSTTTTADSASATQTANGASAGNGAAVYSNNCSSCHQSQGTGTAGAFPPLAKNPVVVGNATQVIHIVKYGLQGAIKVNGQTYNGQMPKWQGTLSDPQIASVLTYIRSSWGNHASGVTQAQVSAVKQ
ncbi:MAG: cytochrome c [Candidatus Eremiobacteraeota bacterium]|nr:cytochrome c [Candidatus Eremiobacteraeota bacterium]